MTDESTRRPEDFPVAVGGHAIRQAIDRRVEGPECYRDAVVTRWIREEVQGALATKKKGYSTGPRVLDHHPKDFRLYGAKPRLAPGQRLALAEDGQTAFVIAPAAGPRQRGWFVVTTLKRTGVISLKGTRG